MQLKSGEEQFRTQIFLTPKAMLFLLWNTLTVTKRAWHAERTTCTKAGKECHTCGTQKVQLACGQTRSPTVLLKGALNQLVATFIHFFLPSQLL